MNWNRIIVGLLAIVLVTMAGMWHRNHPPLVVSAEAAAAEVRLEKVAEAAADSDHPEVPVRAAVDKEIAKVVAEVTAAGKKVSYLGRQFDPDTGTEWDVFQAEGGPRLRCTEPGRCRPTDFPAQSICVKFGSTDIWICGTGTCQVLRECPNCHKSNTPTATNTGVPNTPTATLTATPTTAATHTATLPPASPTNTLTASATATTGVPTNTPTATATATATNTPTTRATNPATVQATATKTSTPVGPPPPPTVPTPPTPGIPCISRYKLDELTKLPIGSWVREGDGSGDACAFETQRYPATVDFVCPKGDHVGEFICTVSIMHQPHPNPVGETVVHEGIDQLVERAWRATIRYMPAYNPPENVCQVWHNETYYARGLNPPEPDPRFQPVLGGIQDCPPP